MELLREYGVEAKFRHPLLGTGADDQQINPTIVSVDVTISKDGGSWSQIATTPIIVPNSNSLDVEAVLSLTEMQAKQIEVNYRDRTSPKEWRDSRFKLITFGHSLAQIPFALNKFLNISGGIAQADVRKWSGNSVVVGDSGYPQVDIRAIHDDKPASENLEHDYDNTGYNKMTNFIAGKVYYNSSTGSAGTTFPIGTARQPSNNLPDTHSIANTNKLSEIMLNMVGGDAAFTSTYTGKIIRGISGWGTDAGKLDLNNRAHTRNIWIDLMLEGTVDGFYNKFIRCILQNFIINAGNNDEFMFNCEFRSMIRPTGDHSIISQSYFHDITFDCVNLSTDTMIMNLMNCTGKITIINLTHANAGLKIYGFKGEIVRDSSDTAGTVTIIGGKVKESGTSGGATFTHEESTPVDRIDTTVNSNSLNWAAIGSATLAKQNEILTNLSSVDTNVDAVITTLASINPVTNKLDTAMELDGAIYRFTKNALEQTFAVVKTTQIGANTFGEVFMELSSGTYSKWQMFNDAGDSNRLKLRLYTWSGAVHKIITLKDRLGNFITEVLPDNKPFQRVP